MKKEADQAGFKGTRTGPICIDTFVVNILIDINIDATFYNFSSRLNHHKLQQTKGHPMEPQQPDLGNDHHVFITPKITPAIQGLEPDISTPPSITMHLLR